MYDKLTEISAFCIGGVAYICHESGYINQANMNAILMICSWMLAYVLTKKFFAQ